MHESVSGIPLEAIHLIDEPWEQIALRASEIMFARLSGDKSAPVNELIRPGIITKS